MIGTNIDPCVVGSSAMISFKNKLYWKCEESARRNTYGLFPAPVPGHKILKMMVTFFVMFLEGSKIKLSIEVGI